MQPVVGRSTQVLHTLVPAAHVGDPSVVICQGGEVEVGEGEVRGPAPTVPARAALVRLPVLETHVHRAVPVGGAKMALKAAHCRRSSILPLLMFAVSESASAAVGSARTSSPARPRVAV